MEAWLSASEAGLYVGGSRLAPPRLPHAPRAAPKGPSLRLAPPEPLLASPLLRRVRNASSPIGGI
jgi:hypothetical protein